jgi:hypothetical protein
MEALFAARLDVAALHSRLRRRLAELQRPVVANIMRAFLEVSALAKEQGLWSLEFAFEEDDARVARIEARFWGLLDPAPTAGDLPGDEVRLTMPRPIPVTPVAARQTAADYVLVMAAGHGQLIARFVTALTDLGPTARSNRSKRCRPRPPSSKHPLERCRR